MGPLRVGYRDKRELRLGDDHAQGNRRIDDVDARTPQPAFLRPLVHRATRLLADVHGRIANFLIGYPRQLETLLNGQAMIDHGELHVLARTIVRRAEDARVSAVEQVAKFSEQLVGRSRHIDALDGKLLVDDRAHTHDGHVGRPLATTEIELRGLREQPLS